MELASPANPAIEKRKKDKIRSAWISFVGRITAQIIGAVATVGLGVVVLNGHDRAVHPTSTGTDAASTVLIATPIRTERETVIVVMPADKASSLTPVDLDRVVKAALTESRGAQP